MDVACEVSSDRLGSDHHSIIITAKTSHYPVPQRDPKWNFKKAKWDAFQDQCITEITLDLFNDAEDKMAIFSNTLLDIAADNIPKPSPFPKRKAKPWFDEDCQAAKKERNKANRLANKHPSAANAMRARLIQARTKKLFKQKKSVSINLMLYAYRKPNSSIHRPRVTIGVLTMTATLIRWEEILTSCHVEDSRFTSRRDSTIIRSRLTLIYKL